MVQGLTIFVTSKELGMIKYLCSRECYGLYIISVNQIVVQCFTYGLDKHDHRDKTTTMKG